MAIQTYHTGRIGLATAGLLALLLLLRAPGRWRSWLLGIAVAGAGFVLAASPLLGYALRNPGLVQPARRHGVPAQRGFAR